MIDWISLWSDLVKVRDSGHQPNEQGDIQNRWRTRAKEFDAHVRRRWTKADSCRSLVTSMLDATPGATVLDIGSGTGSWAVMLAPHARQITGVEPSPAMIEVMQSNLVREKIANVEIIQDTWPHAQVAMHDFTLCSHAMYGFADFPLFIHSMEAVTRQTCFLLIRAPTMDGVMAEAARQVWGYPYDRPNYQLAMNALWQMGIYPNVVMEDSGLWEPWVNDSLEGALHQLKYWLGLNQVSPHDDFLMDLVQRRLTFVDGKYVWPRAIRTALLYWKPSDYAVAPDTLPTHFGILVGSR